MTIEAARALTSWENFYVIVGSSGGALIGLQFVVITLLAGHRQKGTAETLSAFGTPTVVHLAGALCVSAIMSVPWPSLSDAAALLGLSGCAGFVYGFVIVRRARRQTGYEPVWQDWIWYAAAPAACYACLLAAAVLLFGGRPSGFFLVGGSALSLLLIGIHNAWDTVTHIVFMTEETG